MTVLTTHMKTPKNTRSGVFLYLVISYGKIVFSFRGDFLKDAAFCFPGQKGLH